MIDYRYWRLDTPRAASVSELRAVLEAARDEYLKTNTPAVRGVNNLWTIDVPLRDAIVRQITAGIEAAVAVARGLGAATYVQASIWGHSTVGAMDGIDERVQVSVDKAQPPRVVIHDGILEDPPAVAPVAQLVT